MKKKFSELQEGDKFKVGGNNWFITTVNKVIKRGNIPVFIDIYSDKESARIDTFHWLWNVEIIVM